MAQGRKRNPNLNFLVRISSGGVGVFHVKGWGPKSSVCPSKPRETKLFGGIFRDLAGISRRLSGVIRANRFARFARIRFARIGNLSDSGESARRAIRIGVSIANDARACESPVPLSPEVPEKFEKKSLCSILVP